MLKQVATCFLIAAFSVSCASTTIINSIPSGAKIYADGAYLGTTPYTYSDTKIIGSTTYIKLKKKGCQTGNFLISRNEKFEVGPCIGGVLVAVPFLWIMGYNPQRTFEMECSKSANIEDDLGPLLTEKENKSAGDSLITSCSI